MSTPEEHVYKGGEIVTFRGYAELKEGEDPLLKEGQRCKVQRLEGEGLVIYPVDENDEVVKDAEGDMVFEDEVNFVAVGEQEAEAEKPSRKQTKAGKAKAEKAAPEVDEAKAEVEEEGRQAEQGEVLVRDMGLNSRVTNALEKAGIDSLADLTTKTADELAAVKGISKKTVADVEKAMAKHGAELAPEAQDDPTPEVEGTEADAEEEVEAARVPEVERSGSERTESAARLHNQSGALAQVNGTEIEHDEEFLEHISKYGNLHEAASELLRTAEESYYDLGGVLSEIQEKSLQTELGYADSLEGFSEYVSRHLGFEDRKARYHVKIYRTFREVGVPREQLRNVGWTKAREICRISADELQEYVDEENRKIDELLEFAANNSREDLKAYVKSGRVNARSGGTERVQMKKYTFTFVAEETVMIDEALELAQRETGIESMNQALEVICTEWLEMKSFQAAQGSDAGEESDAEEETEAEVEA